MEAFVAGGAGVQPQATAAPNSHRHVAVTEDQNVGRGCRHQPFGRPPRAMGRSTDVANRNRQPRPRWRQLLGQIGQSAAVDVPAHSVHRRDRTKSVQNLGAAHIATVHDGGHSGEMSQQDRV